MNPQRHLRVPGLGVVYLLIASIYGLMSAGEICAKPLPTLWLSLPDSVPEEYRLLEDRLKLAVGQSGEYLVESSPIGAPKPSVNTITLQTNLIMGVEHFYAGRLEKSEELIGAALAVLDQSPSIFREGVVSLPQVREAAMLMVRLHLDQGRQDKARARVQWMLFAFPNIEVSLEKYPNTVVDLTNAVREDMKVGGGFIDWEVLGASPQSCSLILNGTREFSAAPAQVPAGKYVGTFRCGDSFGWDRDIQVRRGQRIRLNTSPVVESEVGLTEGKTTLYQWPRGLEFLQLHARLVGINVASLTPRPHPSGQGMILVAEQVGPQGERNTLGWAEVPDSTLGAATSALVLGSAPELAVIQDRPSLTPWAIGAYSTGTALILGGLVTNLIHNSEATHSPSIDQVNRSSNVRKTSMALYGVGGTALLSGVILQLLFSSPEAKNDTVFAPGHTQGMTTHVLGRGGY